MIYPICFNEKLYNPRIEVLSLKEIENLENKQTKKICIKISNLHKSIYGKSIIKFTIENYSKLLYDLKIYESKTDICQEDKKIVHNYFQSVENDIDMLKIII